ncbi:MAG: GntR family transcriptional regulator [Bryobacterales bacterium]|nr:GntR family transcriptional regulator [Bryobacteraceae bacterium]MDW8129547.1 GntR family transcriptional regulator [Bryobacterales bacterium]
MTAPRYRAIAEILRREIARRLVPHLRLPSESQLARRFRAARETIRRALAELQRDGLVYSRRGAGSFVAEPRVDQDLDRLVGFSEFIERQGLKPGARLLELGVIRIRDPQSPVLRALSLKPSEPLIYLRRLRTAAGHPLVIASTWLPQKRFPSLLERDLRRRSVYSLMADAGYRPERALETIEAVSLNTEQAALLQVAPGSPALLVRRTAWSNGIPVEYAEDYYRGDRTCFRVRLSLIRDETRITATPSSRNRQPVIR